MRIIILLFVFVGPLIAQPPEGRQETKPAEQEKDPAVALARKISANVARFRELDWKREVDIASYSIEELKKFVVKMLDAEMSDAVADRATRAFRTLGVIPRDYDIKKGFKELLVEQVGGFYDPDARQLRVIDRTADENDPTARMVKKLGMSIADMDKTVMAHELIHALQDQHFDLGRFPLDLLDNDDVVIAVASLVEGDATLSMMGVMLPGDAKADAVFAAAKQVSVIVKLTGDLSSLAPGAMKSFKKAPDVLKERMMFPYMGGLLFCLEAGAKKGFAGIDAVFSSPPLSTEQVIHPEKLLGDEKDWPTVLEVTPQRAAFGEGWTSEYHNVMGELFTRTLLRSAMKKRAARKAAAGWDGDRYRLYTKEGAPDCVTWLTTWDSEKDADEFAIAAADWMKARDGGADEDADWCDVLKRYQDGTCDAIKRQGKDVFVLLKAPVDRAAAIVGSGFEAKRTELTKMPERKHK